jgi:hypothetical protein
MIDVMFSYKEERIKPEQHIIEEFKLRGLGYPPERIVRHIKFWCDMHPGMLGLWRPKEDKEILIRGEEIIEKYRHMNPLTKEEREFVAGIISGKDHGEWSYKKPEILYRGNFVASLVRGDNFAK